MSTEKKGSMRPRFVDAQGLAGAWTLGTVQAGFSLMHRWALPGGFGNQVVESNRHLLGGDWEQEACTADEATPQHEVAYVCGTPPCSISGFSLLNVTAAAARKAGKEKPSMARGINSAINQCMRELVKYASRCTGTDGGLGPEVVSFESVQGAGKEGRPLMQALRAQLEKDTGRRYGLSHVFMSGATIGAPQMRHRYYAVFHRIPFGIDRPEPRRVATYRDAIGDLADAEVTWGPQAIAYDPDQTWWLREQNMLGEVHPAYVDTYALGDSPYYVVDAMAGVEANTPSRRFFLEELTPYWNEGEDHVTGMRRFLDAGGKFPDCVHWLEDEHRTKGFSGPRRIEPDRPGYVLTGGCVGDFVHWKHPRFLTVRECARLMGYPDTWSWRAASGVNQAGAWIGKCCPVSSGRWISEWVLKALNGEPGTALGQIDKQEFSFNCTLEYRRWPKEISCLNL